MKIDTIEKYAESFFYMGLGCLIAMPLCIIIGCLIDMIIG